jgi:hypothetical protein
MEKLYSNHNTSLYVTLTQSFTKEKWWSEWTGRFALLMGEQVCLRAKKP